MYKAALDNEYHSWSTHPPLRFVEIWIPLSIQRYPVSRYRPIYRNRIIALGSVIHFQIDGRDVQQFRRTVNTNEVTLKLSSHLRLAPPAASS